MKLEKKLIDRKESKIYFMSDLHYNHENILKMSDRPFSKIQDMNSWIISEITKKITPNDILIDLGDMFWHMSDTEMESQFLSKIKPGMFIKILGNHDSEKVFRTSSKVNKYFDIITDLLDIQVNYDNTNIMCTLCHYGLLSWNHMAWGAIMLMGHSHGNLDEYNESVPDLRVDVGVDGKLCKSLGGSPLIEFSDIYNYFKKKTGGNNFMNWAKTKYTKF